MKTAKVSEAQASPQPAPNFAGWRGALELVRTQKGECAELGARLEQLSADAEKLAGDRKAALADENEETLSRILARREILASRRGKLQAELAEARACAASLLGHAQWRFGSLQKLYAQHVFDSEKAALSVRMVPNCPQLSLEQTVAFLKSVADARALAIPLSQDVEGFIASADKLLAAIIEAGFVVPEFGPLPQSTHGVGAVAEDGNEHDDRDDDWTGPWAPDDGTSIDALCREIAASEPGLTRIQIDRKLRELRPDLYRRRSEVVAMQKTPLSVS